MGSQKLLNSTLAPWKARKENSASGSISSEKTVPPVNSVYSVEPVQQVAIPIRHLHPPWSAYLALALSVIVLAFLVTVTFATIPITSYGVTLSNTGRNVYTVGTTVLSGVIAAAIGEAIKELWLLDILYVAPVLQHKKETPGTDVRLEKAFTSDDECSDIGKPLNRRATVALGLGTMKEKSDFWLQTVSFLTVGLMTTGIVAGLSPDIYNATKNAPQWSVPAIAQELRQAPRGVGLPRLSPTRPDISNTTMYPDFLTWKLANGSWATLDIGGSFANTLATQSIDLLSTFNPIRGIGYVLDGIPFLPPAIGTLALFNNSQNLTVNDFCNFALPVTATAPSGLYGNGQLVSSVACLPALAKNPVQCHAYQNLTEPSSMGNGTLTVPSCTTNMTSPTGDLAQGICIRDQSMATYVFGQPDRGADETSFLRYMTHSLQVNRTSDIGRPPNRNGSYIVACDVDLKNALAYRKVKLKYTGQLNGDSSQQHTFLQHFNPKGSDVQPGLMANVLTGAEEESDDCSAEWNSVGVGIQGDILPQELLVHIVAATWKQIRDHSMLKLMFEKYTKFNMPWNPPGILPGSESFLEEMIGVALGMSLSYSYIADATGSPSLSQDIHDVDWAPSHIVLPAAKVTSTSLRIGPGKPWAIIYALPSLYSSLLLVWLLRRRVGFAKIRGKSARNSKLHSIDREEDVEMVSGAG